MLLYGLAGLSFILTLMIALFIEARWLRHDIRLRSHVLPSLAALLVAWAPFGYAAYHQHQDNAGVQGAITSFSKWRNDSSRPARILQLPVKLDSYLVVYENDGKTHGAIQLGDQWVEFAIVASPSPTPTPDS